MTGELEREEVRSYVQRTVDCEKRLAEAVSGRDVRDAWEDFLGNFGRAIGRMISIGTKDDTQRPWAYRLKNLSTKDDGGDVSVVSPQCA